MGVGYGLTASYRKETPGCSFKQSESASLSLQIPGEARRDWLVSECRVRLITTLDTISWQRAISSHRRVLLSVIRVSRIMFGVLFERQHEKRLMSLLIRNVFVKRCFIGYHIYARFKVILGFSWLSKADKFGLLSFFLVLD